MKTKRHFRTRVPKALQVARSMPPLAHWPDKPEPYRVDRSEVIQWLLAQPEVQEWVFHFAKDCGVIAYDAVQGTWAGVPQTQDVRSANTPGTEPESPKTRQRAPALKAPLLPRRNTWFEALRKRLESAQP